MPMAAMWQDWSRSSPQPNRNRKPSHHDKPVIPAGFYFSFTMRVPAMNRPLVLIILDGWGYAPASQANAISLARKPNYDRLLKEFPNTLIHTSGRHVGLPSGQMGNSEVGHLNIGAGRIVYMDITKIDLMIEKGDFFSNPALLEAIRNARNGE